MTRQSLQTTYQEMRKHLPDRLSETETAPTLEALRQWERADPTERAAAGDGGELSLWLA